MSRKRDREDEEPTLFDLPLDGPAEPEHPEPEPPEPDRGPPEPDRGTEPVPEAESTPFRGDAPVEPAPFEERPEPERVPGRRVPATPPLSVRLLAGLADLAIHLALGVALLFGARLLGVPAGLGDWPPIALFLLVFSFLYSVLPLAFWGQTPGMAWAGVETRAADGGTLTLGQTVRRWLGGMLTVALLGLPLLLAAGDGRSFADRLSDSRTRLVE
ncbi:MAG: RDD family protein [Acidobacteriota bacterium]|jgi:uncharacterized RDD family membrane protein YckC